MCLDFCVSFFGAAVSVMALRRGFSKTLKKITVFFYCFSKVMRRSRRMEHSLLWKLSGESSTMQDLYMWPHSWLNRKFLIEISLLEYNTDQVKTVEPCLICWNIAYGVFQMVRIVFIYQGKLQSVAMNSLTLTVLINIKYHLIHSTRYSFAICNWWFWKESIYEFYQYTFMCCIFIYFKQKKNSVWWLQTDNHANALKTGATQRAAFWHLGYTLPGKSFLTPYILAFLFKLLHITYTKNGKCTQGIGICESVNVYY